MIRSGARLRTALRTATLAFGAWTLAGCLTAGPPRPLASTPSPRQLAWQRETLLDLLA